MGKRAAVVPLLATVLLASSCGSSSSPHALALSPQLMRYMAKNFHVRVRPLRPTMTVRIGSREAESAVLLPAAREWPGVTAVLAGVTDPAPDLMRNRAMWIVLVPCQEESFSIPLGAKPPPRRTVTRVYFVDANTGKRSISLDGPPTQCDRGGSRRG